MRGKSVSVLLVILSIVAVFAVALMSSARATTERTDMSKVKSFGPIELREIKDGLKVDNSEFKASSLTVEHIQTQQMEPGIIKEIDVKETGAEPMMPPFNTTDILVYSDPSDQMYPKIVSNSSGGLWTVYEHAASSGFQGVWVSISLDLGQTWTLYQGWYSNTFNLLTPSIAITGNYVFITFAQDNVGDEQKWNFMMSQDGGATFSGYYLDWSRITQAPWNLAGYFANMDSLAYGTSSIYMAADCLNTTEGVTRTWCMQFTDDPSGGWTVVYWRLVWHDNPGEDYIYPTFSFNLAGNYGQLAYQTWNATALHWNVRWFIFTPDFTDYGLYWTDPICTTDCMSPDISFYNNNGMIVLMRYNNTLSGWDLDAFFTDNNWAAGSIYYGSLQDGTVSDETYPAVFMDSNYDVHVVYVNATFGNLMYLNKTSLYTVSDLSAVVYSGQRTADLIYFVNSPRIVWTDQRNGDYDIYFNSLMGASKVHYTITKVPLLGNVTVDTVDYIAPQTFFWDVASTHNIGCPAYMKDPFDPNIRYRWSSWSDGGARFHDITVGASDKTLTCYYNVLYNVTIDTSPTNLTVTINRTTTYNTPQSFWWLDGSRQTIRADSPQTIDANSRYAFDHWSDSLPQEHDIFVTGPTTYTAFYSVEYRVNMSTNPANLWYGVNGSAYDHAKDFWFVNNSVVPINTSSPQGQTNTQRWAWSNWSDGGAQNHSLIITGPNAFVANFIKQYNVTLDTSPGRLSIQGDSNTYLASHSFWWNAGSTHEICAPSPQPISADTRYVWASWSDFGARCHNITVTTSATYTATFTMQYRQTFITDPAGLNVTVQSVEHKTTYQFWCDSGAVFSVGVPSPQFISPTARYVYDHWSDTGAQSHVVSCNAPTTYTAYFNLEYLVTFLTDPSNLTLEINTVPQPCPPSGHQEWFAQGTVVSVNAPSPQTTADTRAVYNRWSDGGAQSHTITVTSAATYTAYFNTQFLVTFNTVPSGLNVNVDGTARTDGYTEWMDDGSPHTIEAPSPQEVTATSRKVFDHWSDNGTRLHSVVINNPVTFTAYFNVQFKISIQTSPKTDLQVIVDSVPMNAPITDLWWVEGSNHTLGIDSPQYSGPTTRYVFDHWSDGGAQNHTVIVTTSVTFTATFTREYRITISTNPSNLTVEVDMNPYQAPQQFWFGEGTMHEINAPSPQDVIVGQSRYVWTDWSDGGTQDHLISAVGPMTYTATFQLQYQVTISSSPVLGRNVVVDTNSYVTRASFWWDDGSSHPISAPSPQQLTADERYTWVSWSDGGGQSHTITVTQSTTITANFQLEFRITIATNPSGLDVLVDGSTQTAPYPAWWVNGTQHDLDVSSPQPGTTGVQYVFTAWSDGGAQSHTVIITEVTTYTASFITQYQVTVSTSPAGLNVSIEGTTYPAPQAIWCDDGSSLDIATSSPQAAGAGVRRVFTAWDDGTTTISRTVVCTAPATYIAQFKTQYYLSIVSDYGTPTGEDWYDSGLTATAGLDTGTHVVTPNAERHIFDRWSGDASGTNFAQSNPITMNAPKTATAVWMHQFYLTVQTDHGTAIGQDWYDAGASATAGLQSGIEVVVANQERYVFTQWSGDASGTNFAQSDTITMDEAKTAVANWEHQYRVHVDSDYGDPTMSPEPSGDGWYPEGTQVTITVKSPYMKGGNKYIFTGWSGDASGTSTSIPVTANSYLDIKANWRQSSFLEDYWWILAIIVIIIVVAIVVLLMMRKKPAEGELPPPEEFEMEEVEEEAS